MGKIHFEIGQYVDGYDKDAESNQTCSVFSSPSLKKVIKEYQEQNCSAPNYFIDVWETDENGTPFPVADIKIEDWIFNKED